MEEERISRAMARIDAAAQRIEAAASSARSATPGFDLGSTTDSDLARRHDALKKEAWAALAEMDHLIGALET